jgi:hypothetical protein
MLHIANMWPFHFSEIILTRYAIVLKDNADKNINQYLLYMFFWVFPRRRIVVGRRFGTLCQFHLPRLDVDCEIYNIYCSGCGRTYCVTELQKIS